MDTGLIQSAERARLHITEIDTDQASELLEKHHNSRIIDVREPQEFQDLHIAGAINIPLGRLTPEALQAVGVDRSEHCILLYCTYGIKSAVAAFQLQQWHYDNAYSLSGGYPNWELEGLPMVHRARRPAARFLT